jgi:predicted component of type VI protein secretion system
VGFCNRYREIGHRDTEIEHIADDLRHLLNARRGYGSPLRGFGTSPPDPQADAVSAGRHLLTEILNNVLLFVPKLTQPSVRTLHRTPDLVLHVELLARLKSSGQRLRFLLHYNQPYGGIAVEVALA